MEEVATRRKGQAPPPHIVFDELAVPAEPRGLPEWLWLREGERRPKVLRAERPHLVVWTSIFGDRPGDQIRFDIDVDGPGSRVRWTLLADEPLPDDAHLRAMSHRLNELINGSLRATFG